MLLLGLLPARQAPAAPPAAAGPVTAAPLPPADVIILVDPASSTTAFVGMGYRTRVPFARARKEIGRLAEGTGWQIGRLQIEDRSTHPENLKKFPKTTGAEILLQQAPQIQGNAPAVLPYLRAFQAWDHVELIFRLPGAIPAPERDFQNNVLSARLFPDRNVYRYEVDIHDHAAPLPATIEPRAPVAEIPAVPAEPMRRPAGTNVLPALLLIAAGVCLTGCACIWMLLTRRNVSGISVRSIRQ